MAIRALVIQNGLVVNVVMLNSLSELPGSVESNVGNIGDTWNGSACVPPAPIVAPPVVPKMVERLQARLALLAEGKWGLIQPVIDSLSEPQKSIAQAYFEDARYWYRNDAFVLLLAPAIGLDTPAKIDAVFASAATYDPAT